MKINSFLGLSFLLLFTFVSVCQAAYQHVEPPLAKSVRLAPSAKKATIDFYAMRGEWQFAGHYKNSYPANNGEWESLMGCSLSNVKLSVFPYSDPTHGTLYIQNANTCANTGYSVMNYYMGNHAVEAATMSNQSGELIEYYSNYGNPMTIVRSTATTAWGNINVTYNGDGTQMYWSDGVITHVWNLNHRIDN